MISTLMLISNSRKYCIFSFITIGLGYFVLKSLTTQRWFRYYNKWLQKNNTFIVSTPNNVNYAVALIKRKLQQCDKQFLGLDCEWISTRGSRHPVALLQLATPDGFCSLFRLCALKNIPVELADLLEDINIMKVGVAVVIDARYLLADYGVQCEGCLDLRHLASSLGVESRGLASLANELLGVELDKDWRIRCSDWESDELTLTQSKYAAQDATVAVDLFEVLNHKGICSKYSIWNRMFWSKKSYWDHSYNLWSDFIGLNYKAKHKSSGDIQLSSVRRNNKQNKIELPKRHYHTLLHKQHYSNIYLLAPDNTVLCTISDSKANWYIGKGLVNVISEEPKTLRLTFEPARRAEPDGYYTKPKSNRCVVCGSETNLRRKNVVPSEYRKYFEESLKNHHSHDVLLLCFACHTRCNIKDQMLRECLVIECEAPLADGKNCKMAAVPDLKAVKSAARALYNNGHSIPAQRKAYLEKIICDKLGVSSDQLSIDYLKTISDIECYVESEEYVPHGLKVVQYYVARGGINELEKRWRKHFVETMEPKFLPDLWSINHTRD